MAQIYSGEHVQGISSKSKEISKEPDEVVIFTDGKYMTLKVVFESLDFTGYALNTDLLKFLGHKLWAFTGPTVQRSATVLIMLVGNSMFEQMTEDIDDSVGQILETAYAVVKNYIRNYHDALAKFLDVLLAPETLSSDCCFSCTNGSLHFKQWVPGGCSFVH